MKLLILIPVRAKSLYSFRYETPFIETKALLLKSYGGFVCETKSEICYGLGLNFELELCMYTANIYRGLRGCPLVHAIRIRWAVEITEKPYTHQRERLCMLQETL